LILPHISGRQQNCKSCTALPNSSRLCHRLTRWPIHGAAPP